MGALGTLVQCTAQQRMSELEAEASYKPEPLPAEMISQPPAPRPNAPLVAVLVSGTATEITDLLAAYAVLAAAGTLNVYTVAPHREAVTVWPYLEILPHFDFAQFEAAFPDGPDAIVVPYFVDYQAPALVNWLRDRTRPETFVLSVCEGARTVAAAGLLNQKSATSHFAALDELAEKFPHTRWQSDVRTVIDGRLISTAGVSAAADGALLLLSQLSGPAARLRVSNLLGFEGAVLNDSGAASNAGNYRSPALGFDEMIAFGWRAGSLPLQPMAILLSDGIPELQLAAALDVFNRSLVIRGTAVGHERRIFRSRYGLDLIPRTDTAQLDPGVTVLDPGVEWRGVSGYDSYRLALDLVARTATPDVAAFVARIIEYPWQPPAPVSD